MPKVDRDLRFTSRFWKVFQIALGTRTKIIFVFRPQTDGYTKHTIGRVEDMLRAYTLK